MTGRKYEKPLRLNMDFSEAMERFSKTEHKEVSKIMNDVKHGVVHESDLTLPSLRLLNAAPNGFLETTDLIAELEALFNPSGKDAEIIEGRQDTHFSQKVSNIISHRKSPTNPIAKGWIDYHKDAKGLKITEAGRETLASFT